MGWTKKQLIAEALGELQIQGFEYDISPEEESAALRRMDAMAATWDAKGIRIGYAFPSSPDASEVDADAGIPDSAAEALIANLAIRLAPAYGKQVQAETRRVASEGYAVLLSAAAMPRQQQMPSSLPQGAGRRTYFTAPGPFFCGPDHDPLRVSQGGALDIPQDAP